MGPAAQATTSSSAPALPQHIAIIMDAMDLLHQDASKLDGFILVSSDSDFCPLAERLRQAGKRVIGVGQKRQITKEFPKSFDHFIFSDQLGPPKKI